MSERTRGPWQRRMEKTLSAWEVHRSGNIVAGCIRTEADANLLCAAPDLLSALREAREELLSLRPLVPGGLDETISRIDAVLKRVE